MNGGMIGVSPLPTRPTLADVAKHAGVSPVTVSRVVEGSDKVAEKTRTRVLSSMDSLGYFGNAAASQLVSGQTRTIGVITSSISDFGYVGTIQGIEREASAQGYSLMIATIEGGSTKDAHTVVSSVASQALSGVVVLDFDFVARAVLEKLPKYLPVVACANPAALASHDRPAVYLDDKEAARIIASHLVELGHQSIFVIEPPHAYPDSRRLYGFLDVLLEENLPVFPGEVADSWRPAAGRKAALRLLEKYGNLVTCIACANDELALGAVSAVTSLGLRVPEDVSVTGIDNNPIAECMVPPLTTVEQDFELQGRIAFKALRALMGGDDLPSKVIRGLKYVPRESTAPPNPSRGWAVK